MIELHLTLTVRRRPLIGNGLRTLCIFIIGFRAVVPHDAGGGEIKVTLTRLHVLSLVVDDSGCCSGSVGPLSTHKLPWWTQSLFKTGLRWPTVPKISAAGEAVSVGKYFKMQALKLNLKRVRLLPAMRPTLAQRRFYWVSGHKVPQKTSCRFRCQSK